MVVKEMCYPRWRTFLPLSAASRTLRRFGTCSPPLMPLSTYVVRMKKSPRCKPRTFRFLHSPESGEMVRCAGNNNTQANDQGYEC